MSKASEPKIEGLTPGERARLLVALDHAVERDSLSREAALRILDVMDTVPAIDIRRTDGQPAECKVWLRGRLVFDGVSRDALIAAAEQRGREDNADHGMCYVAGSKALAAKMAAAWDEGAAAVEFDQFADEFVLPDNPYRT